ncbi:C40 family peptidase [Weeksellaceae bacterium TAE3-ERU29]|nr:C40 family peptidase [Weeksellaceae bacterium TAE3-ERU29]
MNFGICKVSISPVRVEPNDRSEMVTQLLFGEKVEILESKNNWLKIKADFDEYEGWVDPKQIENIIEEDFFKDENCFYTAEPFNLLVSNNEPLTLPFGAEIRNPEENKLNWSNGEIFEILCDLRKPNTNLTREEIIAIAKNYINVPYLWGGKSNFGIDCSGLIQQVFKYSGIRLPRDANQQALKGEMLGFVEEALPGDIAFFDNEEGKIIHVGLIIENKRIIHAHGKVRIDPIDSTGIFNTDNQNYSHKLRFIKRILPE